MQILLLIIYCFSEQQWNDWTSDFAKPRPYATPKTFDDILVLPSHQYIYFHFQNLYEKIAGLVGEDTNNRITVLTRNKGKRWVFWERKKQIQKVQICDKHMELGGYIYYALRVAFGSLCSFLFNH